MEKAFSFWSGWHIGAFDYGDASVVDEHFSVILVEFVLRGAREREVGFELPDLFFGKEFGLRYMLLIFVDTSSIVFLESPHDIYVDSERIVDSSARIGHGNDFGSEFR